jgi:SAM-dependent methyltransferase
VDISGGFTDNLFVAEFYDHVNPYRGRQDVRFFVEMAQNSDGPVLEIGCGTGRVLIPTARAGVEIVGLDASPPMLSVCKRKLSRESEFVQKKVTGLVEGDMRSFDLRRQFSLVTVPFRPFHHLLSVEDQISCLRSIHRHLVTNGRLVLDVFNPSLPILTDDRYLAEHGEEPEFITDDGRRVVRRARIVARDHYRQVTDIELIYYVTHPDGCEERLVHRFSWRYLFRYEVEHLLTRCGFDLEEVYADYDRTPFGSQYHGNLISVAKKSE